MIKREPAKDQIVKTIPIKNMFKSDRLIESIQHGHKAPLKNIIHHYHNRTVC